jgi:hypothetical protein
MPKNKQAAHVTKAVSEPDPTAILEAIAVTNLVPFSADLEPFNYLRSGIDTQRLPAEDSDEFVEVFLTALGEFGPLVDYLKRGVAEKEAKDNEHEPEWVDKSEWKTFSESKGARSRRFREAFDQFVRTRGQIKLLAQIGDEFREHVERRRREIKEDHQLVLKIVGPSVEQDTKSLKKINATYQKRLRDASKERLELHTNIHGLRAPNAHRKMLAETYFKIISQPVITVGENGVSTEFRGTHIFELHDPRRIKQCPQCQKVFWGPPNKRFCTDKCSNGFHQEIFLSDPANRASHNENRKMKRKEKKEEEIAEERAKRREENEKMRFLNDPNRNSRG